MPAVTPTQQILRELGYDAKPITEGLAVVCGGLGESNFTGIGIACGSGLCNCVPGGTAQAWGSAPLY